MKFRTATILAVTAATALSGCDVSQFAFKVDESITVTSPQERTEVDLPVTVTWSDADAPSDLRVDPSDPTAEYYAVFVDRGPIGPGRTLASLAKEPSRCAEDPACPTADYLRDQKVFLTARPELLLEFLPDRRPSTRGNPKDPHEVTIVRMVGDARQGEAAWDLLFYVNR